VVSSIFLCPETYATDLTDLQATEVNLARASLVKPYDLVNGTGVRERFPCNKLFYNVICVLTNAQPQLPYEQIKNKLNLEFIIILKSPCQRSFT
jgi:hypothetical protein